AMTPYPAVGPTPTTLSAATGARTSAGTGKSRGLWIGLGGAVVVGGIVVTVAATRGGGNSDDPKPEPAKEPAPAAPAPAPTPPPPPPPKPLDPEAQVTPHMKTVLTRFVAWSKDHAGAACPDVAALGVTEQDPWGHPLVLTCSDQPANQIIGAIS